MRTVAIVGSHPATQASVPYHRKDIKIWAFNEAAGVGFVKRADAVFQMHLPPIWKSPSNRNDPNHYKWLQQKHPFPIYMQEAYPEVPSAEAYPLEAVCEDLLHGIVRVGQSRSAAVRYFTSSVAYAIALAIHQKFDSIEIYGIEMSTETEYVAQRPGVLFWLGIAAGRGIEVKVRQESSLFRSLLYGYEGDVVINRQEFEAAQNALAKRLEDCRDNMNRAGQAVAMAVEQMRKAGAKEQKEHWAKEYGLKMQEHHKTIMEFGVISGALQENERYLKRCDDMIRAAGGEKAVEALLEARTQEFAQQAEAA